MTDENKLSRRDFIKGAAVVGAGALLGTSTAEAQTPAPWLPAKWDYEADVVVIGYGFAGQGAAIEAADGGAKVIVLDKAPANHVGGSSLANVNLDFCALGRDQKIALEYLKSECWGSVEDEEVLKAHVAGNFELPAWVEKLGGKVTWVDREATYPTIPGAATWGGKAADKSCFVGYPPDSYVQRRDKGEIPSGWQTWMNDLAVKKGIQVMAATPAIELVQDGATKEILGVKALSGVTTDKTFHYTGGKEIFVKAKKAVVLACGGYENNKEMLHNWAPHPHSGFVTFYGSPYSTGDGVTMATKVGAKLWHLNKKEAHNMASTLASKELGCGRTVNVWATSIANGPGIIVNRDGKRFHNEYHFSGHSDDRREWDRFEHKMTPGDDYQYADYRNTPFFWIFDDTTFTKGPLGGTSQFAGVTKTWPWSKDNKAELAKGWFIKADTIEALAKMIVVKDFFGRVVGMDAAGLVKTINDYNGYCATGKDLEFGRNKASLAPIIKPPFYAMEVCECQTNTQGGPKHDQYMRVLDSYDKPIARLYEAGELGSIFGALYNGGENIPEAASGGRRAAKHALTLKAWDAKA